MLSGKYASKAIAMAHWDQWVTRRWSLRISTNCKAVCIALKTSVCERPVCPAVIVRGLSVDCSGVWYVFSCLEWRPKYSLKTTTWKK